MKPTPPELPNIYNHEYNFMNPKNNSTNETYGEIYKGKIPVLFFNHLMVEKKKSFKKSSVTQRNKKKCLTIIYYSP